MRRLALFGIAARKSCRNTRMYTLSLDQVTSPLWITLSTRGKLRALDRCKKFSNSMRKDRHVTRR
jgi:hypothetical protein